MKTLITGANKGIGFALAQNLVIAAMKSWSEPVMKRVDKKPLKN